MPASFLVVLPNINYIIEKTKDEILSNEDKDISLLKIKGQINRRDVEELLEIKNINEKNSFEISY